MKTAAKSGFSFMEMMVVILIISILAAGVAISLVRWPSKAKVAKAKADIVSLDASISGLEGQISGVQKQIDELNARILAAVGSTEAEVRAFGQELDGLLRQPLGLAQRGCPIDSGRFAAWFWGGPS